jgi:hypothetical protein
MQLRDDYVAVASTDGVRIFRWSVIEACILKRQPCSVLFGSEGVGAMVSDATGTGDMIDCMLRLHIHVKSDLSDLSHLYPCQVAFSLRIATRRKRPETALAWDTI